MGMGNYFFYFIKSDYFLTYKAVFYRNDYFSYYLYFTFESKNILGNIYQPFDRILHRNQSLIDFSPVDAFYDFYYRREGYLFYMTEVFDKFIQGFFCKCPRRTQICYFLFSTHIIFIYLTP